MFDSKLMHMINNKMSVLKGFKVSINTSSDTKKGIGAKSLKDLQEKIIKKFELSSKIGIHIFLNDGTEIDDEEYFQRLPPQTHLIASSNKKLELSSKEIESDGDPLEQFFHVLRWQGGAREAVDQIRDLLLQVSR